jgi:hypothetical protein
VVVTNNRVRAVQERRRSNAAGPHGTRQTRAAMLAQALADDPMTWARMRQRITAVEEAGGYDDNECPRCGAALRSCCYTCPNCERHEDMCDGEEDR